MGEEQEHVDVAGVCLIRCLGIVTRRSQVVAEAIPHARAAHFARKSELHCVNFVAVVFKLLSSLFCVVHNTAIGRVNSVYIVFICNWLVS